MIKASCIEDNPVSVIAAMTRDGDYHFLVFALQLGEFGPLFGTEDRTREYFLAGSLPAVGLGGGSLMDWGNSHPNPTTGGRHGRPAPSRSSRWTRSQSRYAH